MPQSAPPPWSPPAGQAACVGNTTPSEQREGCVAWVCVDVRRFHRHVGAGEGGGVRRPGARRPLKVKATRLGFHPRRPLPTHSHLPCHTAQRPTPHFANRRNGPGSQLPTAACNTPSAPSPGRPPQVVDLLWGQLMEAPGQAPGADQDVACTRARTAHGVGRRGPGSRGRHGWGAPCGRWSSGRAGGGGGHG